MYLRQLALSEFRVSAIDKSEQRERGPTRKIEMSMHRRQLEILLDAHRQTQANSAQQKQHRNEKKLQIDPITHLNWLPIPPERLRPDELKTYSTESANLGVLQDGRIVAVPGE